VTVGDSLTAARQTGVENRSPGGAAADLSTQNLPIEVAQLQFSGADSSAYNVSLQNNVAVVRPSVLFSQPLSRNDSITSMKIFQTLLARSLAYGHELNSLYGTRLVLNSPGCEPSFDGNPLLTAAFNDIRARLQAIGADDVIPHIDGPSLLGQPEAPWNYIPGVCDDGDHPNAAGAELLVPLTTQALRSVADI
jgi:lysophospholipase L1-like esterase